VIFGAGGGVQIQAFIPAFRGSGPPAHSQWGMPHCSNTPASYSLQSGSPSATVPELNTDDTDVADLTDFFCLLHKPQQPPVPQRYVRAEAIITGVAAFLFGVSLFLCYL
jgi:hypothetical protein